MGARKVIQIIATGAHLYALCNDGTIWQQSHAGPPQWDEIKGPPPTVDSKNCSCEYIPGDDENCPQHKND